MQSNGLADFEFAETVIQRLSDKADLNSRNEVQSSLTFVFNHPEYWQNRIIKGLTPMHFETFPAFVTYETPYGLDWTMPILEAFLLPELKWIWQKIENQLPEANKHGVKRNDKECIYTLKKGTSRERRIAILKRDAPAIAKRVIKGEISAAEGMRQAGKKKPVITIPVTVEGFAKAIMNKLNENERNELKQMI